MVENFSNLMKTINLKSQIFTNSNCKKCKESQISVCHNLISPNSLKRKNLRVARWKKHIKYRRTNKSKWLHYESNAKPEKYDAESFKSLQGKKKKRVVEEN